MKVFSVYDLKAQAYLQPFFMRTNGEAMRSFESECKNTQSPFNQFPADFILKSIGTWNDLTGALDPIKPVDLATASEFIKN